jgi:GTP-binding protein EngB required for normal cell division
VLVVATKTDKLSTTELSLSLIELTKAFCSVAPLSAEESSSSAATPAETRIRTSVVVPFSAVSGEGKKKVWSAIRDCILRL